MIFRIQGGETSFAATERMQQQRIQKDEGTRSLNAQIQTLQVRYILSHFINSIIVYKRPQILTR